MKALAVCVALAPAAALAEPPAADPEARCRQVPVSVEDPNAQGDAALALCLAEEERARATLLAHWDGLPPEVREACGRPPPETLGPASYVLVQYCVEAYLVRDGLPLPFPALFFR